MAKPRGFSNQMGLGFDRGTYRYTLAPWVWSAAPLPHWRLPTSAMGGVDLRPLSAQALAGGAPQGFAFCASLQSVTGTQIIAAYHMAEAAVTTGMRDAWESAMGYRPQGANLVDLLWDQLTTGSDPDGIDGPKPLMPGVDQQLKLFVGGHSLVKSERFRFGAHSHTGKVRDLLQRDFERLWERTNGHDHCRRVLDFHCKKYRIDDWREFVPQRLRAHVPGRLPHATTITDNFNRANESLDAGPWVEVNGNWAVASNSAGSSGAGWNLARHTTALSSDDHYAQAKVVSASTQNYAGGAARVDGGGAVTFYQASADGTNTTYLFKLVGGAQTNLASAAHTYANNDLFKTEADGSTIKGYANGAEKTSVTDTAITGNLNAGLANETGEASALDDFEAADLGAAGDTRAVLIGGDLLRAPIFGGSLVR